MKKFISGNTFRIGIALVLVLGLVLGLALPGLAAQEEKQSGQGKILQSIIRGEVVSKDSSSFKVKTNKGDEININVVEGETKFFLVPGTVKNVDIAVQKAEQERIQTKVQANEGKSAQKPALNNKALKIKESVGPKAEGKGILKQDDLKWLQRFGKAASFTDLAAGDKVLVYPVPGADAATTTAKIVLIIKQPAIKQIKGKIESVGGGSITITGDIKITLSYDKDTVFVLKGVIAVQAGQMAKVVYDSEKMLAKRVTINVGED